MAVYLRPGINVVENLTALQTSTQPSANAVAAFVGACNRGPSTPTLINSWGTFQNLFGSFANINAATITNPGYLAYAVYSYFQNGGTPCYVSRPVHTDMLTATRTLVDTAGTPLSTMSITSANPGAWGNSITIDITAGYVTGRFNLIVHFGGAIVETFSDMSMVSTDSRYAPLIINATSVYVVAAGITDATAFPNNAPAVQTGTALASGSDGTLGPAAADYTTALALYASIYQPVVLNLPGAADTPSIGSAILTAAQTYVASNTNTFLVLDTPVNSTVSSAISYATALTPTTFAAVYYPWINILDPSRPSATNVTVQIPPGGSVVAEYMQADLNAGPFQTPAGVQTGIPSAVSLVAALQPTDYDTLNSAATPVNALKSIPGYGICVFGGRTLSGGYPSRYIAVRRSLIYIEQSLVNITQFAVFQPNGPSLWESLAQTCSDWLTDYYGLGGLSGSSQAQAFFVTCDDTNNTPSSISAGIVNISVGVALLEPAEFITITIGQYQGGAATSSNSLNADDDN